METQPTMLVSELLSAFYGSLDSFGPTRIVTPQQAIAYFNMALAQVWSYDGRVWSWALRQERFIPAPGLSTPEFVVTAANPVYRIKSVWDLRNKTEKFQLLSEIPPQLSDVSPFCEAPRGDWSRGDVHYVPQKKNVTFWNNLQDTTGGATDTGGYVLNYYSGFVPVATTADELPVPPAYAGVLQKLMLTHACPNYLQLGDNKEAAYYQQAIAMLEDLAKCDGLQALHLTNNAN